MHITTMLHNQISSLAHIYQLKPSLFFNVLYYYQHIIPQLDLTFLHFNHQIEFYDIYDVNKNMPTSYWLSAIPDIFAKTSEDKKLNHNVVDKSNKQSISHSFMNNMDEKTLLNLIITTFKQQQTVSTDQASDQIIIYQIYQLF